MADGATLRETWSKAFNDAQNQLRALLTSASSKDWKRLSLSQREGSLPQADAKGKGKIPLPPLVTSKDVIIHRKSSKFGDVSRIVLDIPVEPELARIDVWKNVLTTPELRKEFDPAVESCELVEMFDPDTRILKTKFTLGWPANPRDAITISRAFNDSTTLITISTSLPRSRQEPAYLRPSPPYVRSHIHLFAWCIQIPSSAESQPVQFSSSSQGDVPTKRSASKIRVTCFWQHDLRANWTLGSPALSQQLPALMLGLISSVRKRGRRIPVINGYGLGIVIDRVTFENARELMTVEYSVHAEGDDSTNTQPPLHGLDELQALREQKRLERSVEFVLPATQGWDVQISTRGSSSAISGLPWNALASRDRDYATSQDTILCVKHTAPPDRHSVLKVKAHIELVGTAGLRLNGHPHSIVATESRDPRSFTLSQQLRDDSATVTNLSFHSGSSPSVQSSSSTPVPPPLQRTNTDRATVVDKTILSSVRRNYIYFSSLLQEPEAKWKRNTEARGVTVTQLDSIDPTLIVFRAEAVFVGVGLWDLYSTIANPSTRGQWDKLHESAKLVDDVNELTQVWHYKSKPAWPVTARDAVLLRTVYKSPTTIHVFSSSVSDPHLISNFPRPDPAYIRTQVDLQGWAIEVLSPTTTSLTLLEQSDPRGWSNKSSIPQQMITYVAGIGEYAIKSGGPPIVTRLAGAKATDMTYDHEKGLFRLEYVTSSLRGSVPAPADPQHSASTATMPRANASQNIECQLRCDLDTWALSLELVVDPPPQSVTCLKRHRLSSGGGVWLTVTHDTETVGADRLLIIARKATSGTAKEKGTVTVNGARIQVDLEELPEAEQKQLLKKKRVKPVRVPLDQPPVLRKIRTRTQEWEDGEESQSGVDTPVGSLVAPLPAAKNPFTTIAPITSLWSLAVGQANKASKETIAAISPATVSDNLPLSPTKHGMQYALDALAYLRTYHARSHFDGWALVSDKGFPIYRKSQSRISGAMPIYRGAKVIEGVTAEDVAGAVMSFDSRKMWDDKFESGTVLQAFTGAAQTSFITTTGGFPFRGRGFLVASVMAKLGQPSTTNATKASSNQHDQSYASTIFCASASFHPDSIPSFSPSKYNPHTLPIGRIYIDGWILETLDPYATTEHYMIPSTRCTRLVSVDYSGSIPSVYNTMINAALPRYVEAVEKHLKSISPTPFMRFPSPGFIISSDESDEDPTSSSDAVLFWVLDNADSERGLISHEHAWHSRSFRARSFLKTDGKAYAPARSPTITATPRRSRIVNPRIVESTSMTSPGRPGRTESFSSSQSAAEFVRHRRVSSASNAETSPVRRMPGARIPSGIVPGDSQQPQSAEDYLVGEVIVDSLMYQGGYEVQLLSVCKSASRETLSSMAPLDQIVGSALPFVTSIYTLPSNPLHSSDPSTERPPRHLIRITLPTSVYHSLPIDSPLTGETRAPPEWPEWLTILEKEGAVVDISIKAHSESGSDAKQSVGAWINGVEIPVHGEQDSLNLVGRSALEGKSPMEASALLRSIGAMPDQEPLPKALIIPISSNGTLQDQLARAELPDPSPNATPNGNGSEQILLEKPTSSSESLEKSVPSVPSRTGTTTTLFDFFSSYQNPLSRLTSGSTPSSALQPPSTQINTPSPSSQSQPSHSSSPSPDGSTATITTFANRRYPLATVVIVALIAFLVGSLLRSLLSPAEFVVHVTSSDEAYHAEGWREIKRLVEIKYLVGGWDFVVAVVRRH
ncbi:hypothetical protein SISSUDRAFT_1000411 [Sistotremastrum suecicum HHB10207 ss-3]|uniref:START domain-containing protein n=1 Tax=Sistotremastrum suecicum HHB10207 ss-3 TaxID=1314776 RepID=A0A166GK23_9AGAM|nr:hypothetical protein SISSUDRAFT_1000411 [Sistotremastrum suecicum HHB10207 ss-3]